MSHMPTTDQPSSGSPTTPSVSLINGSGGTLVIGTPVYSSASGQIGKARANAAATARVVGLCQADIATAAAGLVQMDAVLTATTAQWDAVAGTSGGLTFNTPYFLDAAAAGKITATAPSSGGQFVTLIGFGVSPTELRLSIEPAIEL